MEPFGGESRRRRRGDGRRPDTCRTSRSPRPHAGSISGSCRASFDACRGRYGAPAALLACGYAIFDADGRHLADQLLRALRGRSTLPARWRLHWRRCYQREAELLMAVQSARLTRAWARTHIPIEGTLPADGAVLVAPHHTAQVFGLLALTSQTEKLGTIMAAPLATKDRAGMDPTWRELADYGRPVCERVFGARWFWGREAARHAVTLLRDGGYLSITGDDFSSDGAPTRLLGRTIAVPRGASWLAQQSDKPIVPYMVIPRRGGWRLWLGEPLPPTPADVLAAVEAGLRRAPESWLRPMAMAWRGASPCTSPDEEE